MRFIGVSLLLFLAVGGSMTRAATLVSNMGESSPFGWSSGYDKAISFTTDATASSEVIRSFSTYAWRSGVFTDPNTYSIGIWSNSGSNTPGSLIAGTTFSFYDYNTTTKLARYSNAGFSLANNTTYWIVVDESGSGGLYMDSTTSTNQTGWALGNNTYYRSAGSTGGWGTDTPVKVELSSTAIPEPSAFSLLAVGLGLVLRRRRNV